jgi:hypothetical protein
MHRLCEVIVLSVTMDAFGHHIARLRAASIEVIVRNNRSGAMAPAPQGRAKPRLSMSGFTKASVRRQRDEFRVGPTALVATAASFGLLWAYRAGDANMRSGR